MSADAILRCVAVALEYDGWTDAEPDYVEAIGVVRELISQSIERLDGMTEPLRCGVDLDAHPEEATSLEDLDPHIRRLRKRSCA